MTELEQVLKIATQNQQRPVGTPPPEKKVAKPAQTTRTYERVNRGGATRQGKDMAMMQTLFGGNPQPKEQAMMTRPVG